MQDYTEAVQNGKKIYQCIKCSYQTTWHSDLAHHSAGIHQVEYGDEKFNFVDQNEDFDYEDNTENPEKKKTGKL